MRAGVFSKTARSIALSCALALAAGCQPGGGDAVNGASGPVASNPPTPTPPAPTPPAPTPPAPPPTGSTTQRQIGSWSERILNADGSINQTEYRAVAAAYNTEEMLQYRLGPTAADFGNATNSAPTLWGPDQISGFGLWPFGILPTSNPGEPEKCVEPARLPRSDQEARDRGMETAHWLVGGAFAYLPDNPQDPEFRYGIGNFKGADGGVFTSVARDASGNITGSGVRGGMCLRMFAQWDGDFWVRNQIAARANTQIRDVVASRRPDLPLVPVAIARGRANASQVGFAAFRDGTILPTVVGNSSPEFFDDSGLRLPAGMIPTAMAVTPYNEFLVVTIWDTNAISGKLAFIALRPRQMAVGNPGQTPNTRWYWGAPGAWTNRGMKLLGFVDLPFAAPTSVDVSNNLMLGNPRGFNVNDDPARGDLSRQSARDLWRDINPIFVWTETRWHQMASAGYAVVASRAEGKVSFVDMTPLYQHYRDMYLTTQSNFNRTVDASLSDPNKWPFTFAVEARQRPQVVTTLEVPQPTSVNAGVQALGALSDRSNEFFEYVQRSPSEAWSGVEPERYMGRSRAFVASMDGTVRIFNVQGLNLPGSPIGKTVPAQPLGSFKAGRNSTFAFISPGSLGSDDLFLVSRGDRSVTFAWPNGQIQSVLRDSRLVDPVAGAVQSNNGGFGGSGPGLSVFAPFISITDYNGKAILTYAIEPRRQRVYELYPFRLPSGQSVDYLFGSRRPFPGKPFVVDMEEII